MVWFLQVSGEPYINQKPVKTEPGINQKPVKTEP
jgi:hypothetical protein